MPEHRGSKPFWTGSSYATVLKVDLNSGEVKGSWARPAGAGSCTGLEYFNGALWIAQPAWSTFKIFKLDPDDGTVIRSFDAPGGIELAYALAATDAGELWIVGSQTSSAILVDTGEPVWLKGDRAYGTLAGGNVQTVRLTLDANAAGLGVHEAMIRVRAGDPDGTAVALPVRFTVTAANNPPVIVSPAWADANPVTLPAGTTVHVVASDLDGDALTYAWTKQSGAGTATFATPAAADSGVTFSAASTYVLRVTVSDGKGGSVSSDVSVTVNPGSDTDARADVNHDGVVNALDLQIIIANFGQTVGSPGCDARADANADGVVNALDLQIVIANFGQTVP